MNRILRSRLSCIAVVLLIPIILLGCDRETCLDAVFGVCGLGCNLPCGIVSDPLLFLLCMGGCVLVCTGPLIESCPSSLECADDPAECAATWEQMQTTAIQICEEYPEECQQAFDTWVESFEEEAIK